MLTIFIGHQSGERSQTTLDGFATPGDFLVGQGVGIGQAINMSRVFNPGLNLLRQNPGAVGAGSNEQDRSPQIRVQRGQQGRSRRGKHSQWMADFFRILARMQGVGQGVVGRYLVE